MSYIFSKRILFTILAIIALIIIGYYVLPVSVPLLLAFFTALVLTPFVELLLKKAKVKRNIAVMLVFVLFVCFIGLSGYFIVTKAVTQGVQLVENLPTYINDINRAWIDFQKNLEDSYEDLPPDLVYEINAQVSSYLTTLRRDIGDRNLIDDITSLVTKIPAYLVQFIVYLIALFLFMLELPRLKVKLYSYFSEKTADRVNFMVSRLMYVISGFIKAQFLVSIVIFAVSLIGLLIIVPELALLMAFIIWIIDFIPIIGSIAILGPWALFHLFTGDIALGSQLLILAGILLVIRRTVEPKVMGQHIGLSPLATLIAMYIGLMLFGVMGFIIGPLIVIAFTSAKEAGIIKMNFKI
ncbi:sporulation integral membrane protein YtvI [Alkalihalobacterium bogoriense]|uniref:sporulation integral membrane protein YtvI n=1 Tax=Alkalihalobacterium bogoriense TaxID=246272 RepID=UPI000479A55B|nr:sporulation integral membrane protein YtvI [Alkalihalobacterium bogoriense]